MPPVVPKKQKTVRRRTPDTNEDPEVRRALDWLRREAQKVQDAGEAARTKESSNARRAIAVLADANVPLERFYEEQMALSTIALFLRQGTSAEMQGEVVRMLARAAVAAQRKKGGSENSGDIVFKRTSSADSKHKDLQCLLGVTYMAIRSLLEIAKQSRGDGPQVDAFALVAELMRENEEVQAEALRCDVVSLVTEKMDGGHDPLGQAAAASCAAMIITDQGIKLMVDSHTMSKICKLLCSHAETVKTAAADALAFFAGCKGLQEELAQLCVFERLERLLCEPNYRLVASSLRAMVVFLRMKGKTDEDAVRLRRYVSVLLKHEVVEGVLNLGIHGVQQEDFSLACVQFLITGLKLLVTEASATSGPNPAIEEKKKEDVLDRKSRRGLNSLKVPTTPAAASPSKQAGTTVQGGSGVAGASSKPLIAQLLKCKSQFRFWIMCLLSTTNSRMNQAAIDLITLSIDRKRDFVAVFSVPSIGWALTSVCARNERDESARESALKRLIDLSRVVTSVGAHLHNTFVHELAERLAVKLALPASWEKHVANANKRTVELDLENALILVVDKRLDVQCRSEVLCWIRSMMLADPSARRFLSHSGGLVEATYAIFKGDLGHFPLVFKTRSIELLGDSFYDASARSLRTMFHPTVLFRSQHTNAITSEAFTFFMEQILLLLDEERRSRVVEQEVLTAQEEEALAAQETEGAVKELESTITHKESASKRNVLDMVTQELIVGLGYVLVGMLHENAPIKMIAVKRGLCERALDLLANSDSLPCRRLGSDILGVVCRGAPSLSRHILSLGLGSEFIVCTTSRSERESFPPVLEAIFGIIRQMEAAPPPKPDMSALDQLSEAKRNAKLKEFDAFVANFRMQEQTRLGDLEPLCVSSLHLLSIFCGADYGIQNGLDLRWSTVRESLRFVHSNLRSRCWSNSIIFDILAKIVLRPNPAVAFTVLQLLSGMCEDEETQTKSDDPDFVPKDQLITDAGLILTLYKQLDHNTAMNSDDSTYSASGGGCLVSSVSSVAISALAGLMATVPYAPFLDKVAGRMGALLCDALMAKNVQSNKHLLACFGSLSRCHPTLRAPFYSCRGLEALFASLNIEDGECSVFAANAIQLLAEADVRAEYGLEIDADFTSYYIEGPSTNAIKILVQLIQRPSKAPQNLARYVRALGALGRNGQLSKVIAAENGVFLLVRLLSSSEACVLASTLMALADLCTDPFAFDLRNNIKLLGALPCVLSIMSSPDHLVQEAACAFIAIAGQDVNLRPTFVKFDAVGHLLRLMEITSCTSVQAAALRAAAHVVQSTASAKRFMNLGGCDLLHKALSSSNDEYILTTAAFAVGAISSRTDSATSTVFADIRRSLMASMCYHHLLDIIDKQKYRSDAVTLECMKAFQAFCQPGLNPDSDLINNAMQIIKNRAEDAECTRQVRLCAIVVCASLSHYATSFLKEERKWLLINIQASLVKESMLEKISACKGMAGVLWDKSCKDTIVKRTTDLEVVYEMLKDNRGRQAAAQALEELVASDGAFAAHVAKRGDTVYLYHLLRSASASEAAQAAKTMSAMSKTSEGLVAILAEIPGVKKEGILPIIDAMNLHELPKLKIACAECIAETVQMNQWTVKVSSSACPGLIRMLQNTHEDVVLSAARTLEVMAKFPSTHLELKQQGAILTLNALLTDSSERVRIAGCVALKLLSRTLECNELMLRVGAAKTLIDMMRKDVFSLVCRAGDALRTMLQQPNAQSEFIFLDGMSVLLGLLESPEADVRRIPGPILVTLLLNPRNKEGFKGSELFFKCLEVLAKDSDLNVRRGLCEAMFTFAGNDAKVNIEYKTALYESGFIRSLHDLLQERREGSLVVKIRTVAAKALRTMCSIVAVQDDIHCMRIFDTIAPLLDGHSAQEVVAIAGVVERAVRYHVMNRQAGCRAGILKALGKCLLWETSLKGGEQSGPSIPTDARVAQGKEEATKHKDGIKVRAAAANALSALLECPSCRRTYQGRLAVDMTIQGWTLRMPSVVDIYDCPHRDVCLACAQEAAECNVADLVLAMLNTPEAALRNSAAHLLCSLAIGAPYHGHCDLSIAVQQKVLESGTLAALLKMVRAKDAFAVGRAAAEQFAAARAIDSLATSDTIRYACCKAGFIKALVEMLFSTLGRVKGSAALALARLCASEHLHFYYNTQTEKTYWDKPDDLCFSMKPDGSRDEYTPEDVERDVMRKGFWVRGIFRPFELVPFYDMLVNSVRIKHGKDSGMHKMKADASIVTDKTVLDLILDIFKSPIYDSEVNGWAAEACAIVSEFSRNRQRIAQSGCVPDIVMLLNSDHSVWKEQAAIGLAILMYNDEARGIAGNAGVVGSLTEILLSPYSPFSLKESAALAMAKACWNATNQVLGLQSGALMPLIAMLTQPDIRQWCCAVEALMSMSSNLHCRTGIGQAGAIPVLVNKLTLEGVEGETPAQVRLLSTLTNVLSVPENCDMAVNCGILMSFIDLTKSDDLLLLNYLTIAMATILRCERWKKRFVGSGLVQALLLLLNRYAHDTDGGQRAGAPTVRIQLGRMLCDISDGEEFKTSMVHLGAFPTLKILAHAPEEEAQARAAETIANLAFSDEFKDQARLDGLIPSIAHLMRKRSLEVQLEAARAVRVLGCNHKNKLALVEAGALHGLRDMLDHNSSEARIRATAALGLLATNQDNGAALSTAGAVRPIVNLLDENNPDVLAGATRVLAEVARTGKMDTRGEIAAWGAIPKLSSALESSDERVVLQVSRIIDNMTTADALSSKAAHEARSFMLMEQRIGHVHADITAKQNRQEMAKSGIASKLKPIVDSCRDPATRHHATSSIDNILGRKDL